MSDAKVRLDEKEAALLLLDEAARLEDAITQHSSRSSVLNTIADRYTAHGLPEKALSAARQSLAVISEIRDESSQAAGLAVLADVYEKAGLETGEVEAETLRAMMRKSEW